MLCYVCICVSRHADLARACSEAYSLALSLLRWREYQRSRSRSAIGHLPGRK